MASLGALESRSNVVVLFRTIFPMHFEDLKRDVESIRLRLGFEKKKLASSMLVSSLMMWYNVVRLLFFDTETESKPSLWNGDAPSARLLLGFMHSSFRLY